MAIVLLTGRYGLHPPWWGVVLVGLLLGANGFAVYYKRRKRHVGPQERRDVPKKEKAMSDDGLVTMTCPRCQNQERAHPDWRGRKLHCLKCGALFFASRPLSWWRACVVGFLCMLPGSCIMSFANVSSGRPTAPVVGTRPYQAEDTFAVVTLVATGLAEGAGVLAFGALVWWVSYPGLFYWAGLARQKKVTDSRPPTPPSAAP